MTTDSKPHNTHASMWEKDFPMVQFIRLMPCNSLEYIELAIDNLQIAIAEIGNSNEEEHRILSDRLLEVMAFHRDCHCGLRDPDHNHNDYDKMINLVGREDTRMVRDNALYIPYGKPTAKMDGTTVDETDFIPVTTVD